MPLLANKPALAHTLSAGTIMGLRVAMLGAKFLLSLFIARYMGLDQLGIYGLIVGAAALGQIFMRFGIFSSLSRDAVNQPLDVLTRQLKHYLITVNGAYGLLIVPIMMAVFVLDFYPAIIIPTLLIIQLEHLNFDVFVLLNNLGKYLTANILLCLQSASWIYLYMALAFFDADLQTIEIMLKFWVGAGIASLLIAAFILRKWPWMEAFRQPFQTGWIISHVIKSWRLYISEMMSAATSYIDRYIITLFLSLEMVGVYVLFWQIANAICNLVGASTLQIFRPKLINAAHKGEQDQFKKLNKRCYVQALLITSLLSIIAAIVIPYLIPFTKKPLAMEHLSLFWVLLVALYFRIGTDITKISIYAQRLDHLILKSNIVGLSATVIFGFILLPIMGVWGAVLSSIIGFSLVIGYIEFNRNKTNPSSDRS